MAGLRGATFPNLAQYRRDFSWLISCPSLLIGREAKGTSEPWDHLKLDFKPAEDFLESKAAYRVGYYAEALINVWLESLVSPDEIKRSIQIQEGSKTVGELDFLYRIGSVFHHLEVALKFYLYCPEENHTGSHLVGPNSADTFERKRDRFFQHQLPLGRERFSEVTCSEIMMKGMIFYPPVIEDMIVSPEGLNPDHRRGRWVHESEVGWIETVPGICGASLLEKPFWLSGIPYSKSPATAVQAVQEHFEKCRHPLLLSLKDENGSEIERVFVVADEWPAKS